MTNLATLFSKPAAASKPLANSKFSAIANMVMGGKKIQAPAPVVVNSRPDPFATIADRLVNSEMVGGAQMTVNDVRNEVQHAVNTDARFKTQRTNDPSPCAAWIQDMLLPDENGWWTAIISQNSLYYKIAFKIDSNGHATLSPLPPMETKLMYNSATAGANAETIAAGSEANPQDAINAKTAEGSEQADGNEAVMDEDGKDGINGQSKEDAENAQAGFDDGAAAATVGPTGKLAPNTNSGSK